MLLLFALFVGLATVAQALTSEQAASFFSTSTAGDLRGDTVQLPRFDFSLVQNSTHALFVVNATSTAPSDVGWLGTGRGTSMANADFLLAWPVVSGLSVAWTLSHRLPSGGHTMPQSTGAATNEFYTLVPELTTADASSPFSAVAFSRLRDPGASYPTQSGVTPAALEDASTSFIYASSSSKPSGTVEGARISQHNQPMGTTSLDLSKAFVVGAASAGQDQTNGAQRAGQGRSSKVKTLIAHATLGSLAFLVFMPLAILAARVGRDRFGWFPAHAAFNAFSAVLIIVCFALGTHEARGAFSDFHRRLGLALLILVLLQTILGYGAHLTRPTPLTASRPSLRPPSGAPPPAHTRTHGVPRLAHVLLGLTLVALGWAQVASGLYREWPRYVSGAGLDGPVPREVKVVFWVLVGVWIAVYLAAWVAGAVRKRGKGRGSEAGESAQGDKGLVRQATGGA
ncbi:hypothetical protein JCM10449v2_003288 [Rhodotorula kratochvilovae]